MGPLGDSSENQTPARWGAIGLLVLLGAAILVALANERIREEWTPSVTPPAGAPRPLRPIALVRITEEEFRARLAGAGTRQLETLRACQRRLHQELGLLGERQASTPVNTLLTANDHLPTAAYLPGQDTVLVYYKSPVATLHEWLHALEDQYGERLAAIPGRTTTDERSALRATSEGFALARSGGLIPSYRSSADLDGTLLRVSYSVGGGFFRDRPTDWEADLQYMPTSLGDLIGATMAKPTEGTLLPNGCTDRLGPTGVLTLAGQLLPDHRESLQLARLWVGDSASMTYNGGRNSSWVIWMRDAPASRELENALRNKGDPKIRIILGYDGT